jgi:hypothetical protein
MKIKKKNFNLKFWNFLKILKFNENWNFWKFWNLTKILIFFWNFGNFEFFWNLKKKNQFSLIDDEVRVFRINIKFLSNPVAELKICENDSHSPSMVLKTMDRSIVKKLEKEKNSYFNVEKFVVMFIYWGTIIYTYWLGMRE